MQSEIQNDALCYLAPIRKRAKRSVVVPESHTLHICPAACGRRFAISSIEKGTNEHVSFLFLGEDDVVTGKYEQDICDAIDELLSVLSPAPKGVFLHFKCIDDFLGTDDASLAEVLRCKHPETKFAICRLDPVALDGKVMPGMLLRKQQYAFLERSNSHDNGINFVGTRVDCKPDKDLVALLEAHGFGPFRDNTECNTYEEYRLMEKSCLNIVTHWMSLVAARDMKQRLGIPFCIYYPTFDAHEVVNYVYDIAKELGMPCPDLSAEVRAVEDDYNATGKMLKDLPVALDSTVTMQIFSLARIMLEHGYNVTHVFAARVPDVEAESYAWLCDKHPEIVIGDASNYKGIFGESGSGVCLAVGYEGACVLRAIHYVEIDLDDDYHGFSGIHQLLAEMRDALGADATWEDVLVPGRAQEGAR